MSKALPCFCCVSVSYWFWQPCQLHYLECLFVGSFKCLFSIPYICVFPVVSWPIQRIVVGMYWSQQHLCWSSVRDWSACSRMPTESCVIICNGTSYVRLLVQMINQQLWAWSTGEMVTVSSRYGPKLAWLPCQCFPINKTCKRQRTHASVNIFLNHLRVFHTVLLRPFAIFSSAHKHAQCLMWCLLTDSTN